MRTRTFSIGLLVMLLAGGLLVPPSALARDRGIRLKLPRVSSSPLREIGKHIRNARPSRHADLGRLSRLGSLFDHGGRSSRYGDWRGFNPYGGHDRYYDSDKAYAEAFRDAAIANAVASVVGVIATAPYGAYGRGYGSVYAVPYGRPGAVAVAPPIPVAPAAPPMAYAPPAGHYETERVLVREGHYEEYQVTVPDMRDARTGDLVRGHTEIRQRYVPEVWQERQVWVTP